VKSRVEEERSKGELAREAKAALEAWLEEGGQARRRAWAVRNKINWKKGRHRRAVEAANAALGGKRE